VPGELAKTAPDKSFAYSWFPMSSARKGRKIQTIGNHNAIIPTAAQHRDDGWRLSEFLVSNEAIKIIFDGTGFLAPTREFLASPDSVVNTKQYEGLDFYVNSVKEADELLGWPPCPIEPFAWDQWQKAIDAVIYKQKSIDQELADLQKNATQELTKTLRA
jgi:ABC-type glycerol-3-phosphate transport system substrate-binding protein